MPAGRPSSYSKAIADEICDRVSQAESITSICQSPHMPNASTVFRWLNTHDEFCKNLARARETMADYISFQIIDIAEEKPISTVVGDGWSKTCVDSAGVQRNKLRIDARVKLMQLLKPKTYSEKLDINHTGELGIKTILVPSMPKDAGKKPTKKPEFSAEK